jgi:hypothetical protein
MDISLYIVNVKYNFNKIHSAKMVIKKTLFSQRKHGLNYVKKIVI